MHEAHHPIGVPNPAGTALRISCSCGWRGPWRYLTDGRVAAGLLADDKDWHDEKIASGPAWATSK